MTLCALFSDMYLHICLGVSRVLHEHIQRLSKVVTANHRALQIPEVTQAHRMGGVGNYSCTLYCVHVASVSRKQNIMKCHIICVRGTSV